MQTVTILEKHLYFHIKTTKALILPEVDETEKSFKK